MAKPYSDIIILDEWVSITWAGKNITYYQELGYAYTGWHDQFWCHIDDLSHGANVQVLVRCPGCEDERLDIYSRILNKGHSACVRCRLGNGKPIRDLSGYKFGRLTVIELDGQKSGDSVCWLCECECGNIRSVLAQNLTRGYTVSCGCYHRERMTGKNSPNWNPDLTDDERLIRRNRPGYKEYIKDVMKRDNWTCQCCGRYGVHLEVHHLYSYSDYPDYQIDTDYGVTLCKTCHNEFHWSFMGSSRTPCTPDDYNDWINSR